MIRWFPVDFLESYESTDSSRYGFVCSPKNSRYRVWGYFINEEDEI